MIKIKLSKMGGYVVGDGPCPFDPDQFMKYFMNKIIQAQVAGMEDVTISDEEIAAFVDMQWDKAVEMTMPNKTSRKKLMEEVCTSLNALSVEQ
jgi:hypothetical protein